LEKVAPGARKELIKKIKEKRLKLFLVMCLEGVYYFQKNSFLFVKGNS